MSGWFGLIFAVVALLSKIVAVIGSSVMLILLVLNLTGNVEWAVTLNVLIITVAALVTQIIAYFAATTVLEA